MLKPIIDHLITKEERKLGANLDYLRDIAHESESGFLKLALAVPFAHHRQTLPKTAYYLAMIVTTAAEDCGECLEMAVNAARKDEVPAHYVRAALNSDFHLLPGALENVCLFTRAVLEKSDDADLRDTVRLHYGEKGLIELGFVISGSRLFPTIKRALGRSTSCSTRIPQLQLAC